MKNDVVIQFVAGVFQGLDEDDFVFSVEVRGADWDVYKFLSEGVPGLVAFRLFRQPDGRQTLEYQFLREDTVPEEEEVKQQLEEVAHATSPKYRYKSRGEVRPFPRKGVVVCTSIL